MIDKDEYNFRRKRLLTSALDVDIKSVSKVEAIEDFIPSHIDKTRNSVISQLGYIPTDLEYDAVEILWNMVARIKYISSSIFTGKRLSGLRMLIFPRIHLYPFWMKK